MSTVHEVRYRVLQERLKHTIAAAERDQDDTCWRLAMLCLVLLTRHQVNGNGRCRYCRTPRGWWRRRSHKCTVFPVVGFHLEQPRKFLNG